MVQFMVILYILANNDEWKGHNVEKKIVLAPCNTASKIFENEKKYSDPNSLLIFDYRISYEILQIFLRLFKC